MKSFAMGGTGKYNTMVITEVLLTTKHDHLPIKVMTLLTLSPIFYETQ